MKWSKSVSLLQNFLTHFAFLKLSVNVFCQVIFPSICLEFFGLFLCSFRHKRSECRKLNQLHKNLSKMPQIIKKILDKIKEKMFYRQKTLTPAFQETECVK